MTNEEIIAVVTAASEGKVIECRDNNFPSHAWRVVSTPIWNFSRTDYRVALPPREFWLNEYPAGLSSTVYLLEEDACRSADPDCLRQVKFVEVVE